VLLPAEQVIDHSRPGFVEVRSDSGHWGGINNGEGLICMVPPTPGLEIARKEFDLTELDPAILEQARQVNLRFVMRLTDSKAGDGLNSRFAVSVNGHDQEFSTDDQRFAGWKKPGQDQFATVPIQKEWLIPGGKQFVTIRKTAGDDYLYPWIDNAAPCEYTSFSRDSGQTFSTVWNGKSHTMGEMMMRLQFLNLRDEYQAVWRADGTGEDGEKVIGYAAMEGDRLRLELVPGRYNDQAPVTVQAEYAGKPGQALSTDIKHQELKPDVITAENSLTTTFASGARLFGLEFTNAKPVAVTVTFAPTAQYPAPVINPVPVMAPPCGQRRQQEPRCELTAETAVLSNQALRADFQLRPHLALRQLHLAEIDRQILLKPEETLLLRFEYMGKIYSLREACIVGIRPLDGQAGFLVDFSYPELQLSGQIQIACLEDELEFCLKFHSDSEPAKDLKVAFPHFSGLQLSDQPEDDYYLVQWGGGLVANQDIFWRSFYGADIAEHQFMEVFSTSRGGGMYLHIRDEQGLLKSLDFRKGYYPLPDFSHPLYDWPGVLDVSRFLAEPLAPTSLCALTVAYQQISLKPGGDYDYPPARLGTHAGNWKAAAARYAAWAKKTWPPRPYPSALTGKFNLRGGFGLAKPLLNNPQFDKSYIGLFSHDPATRKGAGEVIEMIGWNTIGRTAPLGVPFEKDDILGPKYWRVPRWIDPATGTLAFSYHIGDYLEYNPQWGGLPVLKAHIDKVRQAGQLPIFYLTPMGISMKTKAEERWMPRQAVINPYFKNPLPTPVDPKEPIGLVLNYMKYCVCIDNAEYIKYIADTVAQVCRDTGIDGFRLDELGNPGYICRSTLHEHLFQTNRGDNAWMRAVARMVKEVHAAMDDVRPGLVLLTEFPGNDMVFANLEGALTYDSQTKLNSARPAPINLQRVYFPECRLFEIDTAPDAQDRWFNWFWNANGTYNSCYNEDLRLILNANADAYAFGQMETLEDGFPAGILVNRFTGKDGRLVRNLLNINPVTRMASVPARPGWKYVELLTNRELPVQDGQVTVPVRPRSITAVAEVRDDL
ncbi:MAG: hypothetical protein J6866_04680, partial [Victivallales bacterium]|nr:hypothetical protein [Victivallales bacterium]